MRLLATLLNGLLISAALSIAGTTYAQTPAGPMADNNDPLGVTTTSRSFPVMYAFYSPAWSVSSNAGLRLVAENKGDTPVTLHAIEFRGNTETRVELNLEIAASAWAESEMAYVDLLAGNDCIDSTLADRWRLMEISNYSLNPSVRGLIIEDTISFRIFQCVRPVRVQVIDDNGQTHQENLWVMYHFERLPLE